MTANRISEFRGFHRVPDPYKPNARQDTPRFQLHQFLPKPAVISLVIAKLVANIEPSHCLAPCLKNTALGAWVFSRSGNKLCPKEENPSEFRFVPKNEIAMYAGDCARFVVLRLR